MKKIMLLFLSIVLVFRANIFSQTDRIKNPVKKVAITIDDLPFNRALRVSNEEMKLWVEKLLDKIKTEKIPVVAFVNENKLEVEGQRDSERVKILKMWIEAGVELGNHTYAHKSGNRVPIDEYKEDIVKGEKTITELMTEKGMKPRYFRHPFLQTGRTLEYKYEVENFLSERGYTIAPVTFDNAEWIYAAAYDNALQSNVKELLLKIGAEYIEYMEMKIRYFENQTQKLFGRQINQILLIHSNRINADYFGKLCKMIRGEGYEFISLEESLKDEAYNSPDTFTGAGGISWLDRWAVTRGKKGDFFKDEPRVPKHIMEIAGVDSE